MVLPRIEVDVNADTRDAEAGLNRVEDGIERVGAASGRASQGVDRFSRRLERVSSRQGALTNNIRNMSFQLNDFAVQTAAGTAASVALAQQLPQMVQGFGTFGAVLSAVVAIAIPLATAMKGAADQGRDVTEVFGTLEPLARSLADSMGQVKEIALDFAEVVINNIDRMLVIGGTAAAFFAGRWVISFVAARVATLSLASSLVFLRGALIRTGFGALIVGAGELVFQFTRLSEAAGGVGKAFGLLVDVGREAFSRIGLQVKGLGLLFKQFTASMSLNFISALHRMTASFVDFTQDIANGFNSLFGTSLQGLSQENVNAMFIPLRQGLSDTLEQITGDIGAIDETLASPFESITRIKELLQSLKDERLSLPDVVAGDEDEGKQKLADQEKRIREHFDRIRALTRGSLSDQAGAWGDYFSNLVQLTGTNNQKLLQLAKGFSAAQALIDAWTAHNRVLADPTLPWFARVASAAQVLAAGLGAVSAIKSVSASGGGGGGAGGGASAGAAAAPAQQPLEVRLSGVGPQDMLSGNQISTLLDRLQDEAGDRGYTLSLAR